MDHAAIARSRYVWLDGEFVPWADAKIHVASECVMRGANVFEGLRGYWNPAQGEMYVFKLTEHMDRLYDVSMKLMRMTLPYSKAEFARYNLELIRKNEFRVDIHMRPTVYFGVGKNFGYKPEDVFTGAFIRADAQGPRKSVESGLKACVSTWTRISDRSSPPRIKAGANYQNNRLALYDAFINGYDQVVLLTDAGKVAEGHGSCLFMVRDGQVVTPSVTQGILEGITRTTLIQLYRAELGIQVVEREIDRTELYVADEVFICGTQMEITPYLSIDQYPVGTGQPGELTRKMQEIYFNVVMGNNPKYRHWLTPVYGA